MDSKQFLYEYLNNSAPTGFEYSGQKIWRNYILPYVDETFTDAYGSTVGLLKSDNDYKVVIEAHADEISWFVNYIDEKGFIYVIRNGGSDHSIAPSKRVNIHTDKGIVKAVFGWPAIHVRDPKSEPTPSMKNIFLDCGASSKEAVERMGVQVGCVATFEDELIELNDTFYTGRALDNKIGGFIIAQAARKLKEQNIQLPFHLYVVNSVQEEIGLRGAEMITQTIRPNIAIVTDVTHDTSPPLYDKKIQGDTQCGKGPVITFGPAVQNNLVKKLIQVAEQSNIPYQRAAVSRFTGTDTDAFAYSNGGVPSVLMSTPLRYMHTTVETVHKQDVENLIDLFVAFLQSLQPNENYHYL